MDNPSLVLQVVFYQFESSKKSQKTPNKELEIAEIRLKNLQG